MRLRAWIVALTVLAGCTGPGSSAVESEDPAALFAEIQGLSAEIESLRARRNELIGRFNDLPAEEKAPANLFPETVDDPTPEQGGVAAGKVEPAGTARAESDLKRRRAAKEAWVEAASRLDDPGRKAAAVGDMRAALAGEDEVLARAAVDAFNALYAVEFDKAPFRPLLLPFVREANLEVRIAALYALHKAGREPDDLALVLQLAHAASSAEGWHRSAAAHLVFLYTEGRILGDAALAVLTLLESDDAWTLSSTANALWGAEVSSDLEARLFEIQQSGVGELEYKLFYSPLSTLQDKSEAVIDLLEEKVQSLDPNDSGRAMWGLGQGVPERLHPRVADLLVSVFESRSTMRSDCLRYLGSYGGRAHLDRLEDWAVSGDLPEGLRERARRSAQEIRVRLAR